MKIVNLSSFGKIGLYENIVKISFGRELGKVFIVDDGYREIVF